MSVEVKENEQPANPTAQPKKSASSKPVTVPDFLAAKLNKSRLTMLTAYDYTMARLLDAAGVDGLLVGDSLGMVVQGNENSLGVILDEIIYHTKAVVKGVRRSLVVADMPFMSYQLSSQQALENAGRLIKEAEAHAVKLEGGRRIAGAIDALVAAGIPVMAHIGMTPQSVRRYGGFKVQRNEQAILDDARAVEEAGAFAVVVECVPAVLADKITQSISIPTIGIGAGAGCDGQILVTHDMLGLFSDFQPKFVKRFADLGGQIVRAVAGYCQEVRDRNFPSEEHTFR